MHDALRARRTAEGEKKGVKQTKRRPNRERVCAYVFPSSFIMVTTSWRACELSVKLLTGRWKITKIHDFHDSRWNSERTLSRNSHGPARQRNTRDC